MRYYLAMPPSGTARYTKVHLVEELNHRRAMCGRRVYAEETPFYEDEWEDDLICQRCLKMTK